MQKNVDEVLKAEKAVNDSIAKAHDDTKTIVDNAEAKAKEIKTDMLSDAKVKAAEILKAANEKANDITSEALKEADAFAVSQGDEIANKLSDSYEVIKGIVFD